MSTLDWSQRPAVESSPEKVSGAWVFRGTRMPVATVFENLEAGATIEDIMEWFDLVANRSQPSSSLAREASRLPPTVKSLGTKVAIFRNLDLRHAT